MKRTIAAVLVALMTILCIGGGYSESDALSGGIEAEEIIPDQLPEPEQESEEDMATGDKLVNLDDLKVAYDKQQEDTNSLKSALDDEKNNIGVYSGYAQNGYLSDSGAYISPSSYHSKTTEMIPCSPGDKFYYMGKAGTAAVSALFYNSNKEIIGNSHSYLNNKFELITVPDNTAYVVFSSMQSLANEVSLEVYKSDGKYGKLCNNDNLWNGIPGTRQVITFNSDGTVAMVTHTNITTNTVEREDVFTYSGNTITEVRTLSNGKSVTLTFDTENMTEEVI